MSITYKEDALVWKNGLGEELSLYTIFSVFLQREILNSENLDIRYVPTEYVNYMAELYEYAEESGDLVLVTMLFTEYCQKQKTGQFKVKLTNKKYKQLGLQFALFCKLELMRRVGEVKQLNATQLFNPNIKTSFTIFPITPQVKEMLPQLQNLGVVICSH
jgi:hypothetical protein